MYGIAFTKLGVHTPCPPRRALTTPLTRVKFKTTPLFGDELGVFSSPLDDGFTARVILSLTNCPILR